MKDAQCQPVECISKRRRLLWLCAVVLLVALPLRLYLATTAVMVSRDTVSFIDYAQQLGADPVDTMRSHAQHPFYPILLLVAHRCLDILAVVIPVMPSDPVVSWAGAAVAVAFIGGLAVVVASYWLALVLFDDRIGLIAALLAATAAEFCQLSADGLTDMPHLALYLAGLAAGVQGVRDRRVSWLACSGVLSGLAYLTRPEGAEAVLVVAVAVACWARTWNWKQRLLALAAVGMAAGAVAVPYMVMTGKLVQKKSVRQLLHVNHYTPWGSAGVFHVSLVVMDHADVDPGCVSAGLGDFGRACGKIGENWARSLRVTYLLPAIAWCLLRRRRRDREGSGRIMSLALGLHLVVLFALLFRFEYWRQFSLRHVMILAGLTLPYSAAGLCLIADRIPARRRRLAFGLMSIILLVPTLPWMFEVRHADALHLRDAGQYIRRHAGDGQRILTDRTRVVYYAAGCPVGPFWNIRAAEILKVARRDRPDWIVFDEARATKVNAGFLRDLERTARVGELGERIEIGPKGEGKAVSRAILYRYAGLDEHPGVRGH